MDLELVNKCDNCSSEEGIFRPVEKANSGTYFWVCSEKCDKAIRVMITVKFEACDGCKGAGGFRCGNPFCPVGQNHKCEDCEGSGLTERTEPYEPPEVLH